MPRIDRTRLIGRDFPDVLVVPTRFADLDMQGHVNNVALGAILQEARACFDLRLALPRREAGQKLMIAALTTEFVAELGYPEPVEVRTGILAVGRSSYTLGHVVLQRGRVAIVAEAVMVAADANGPVSLTPAARAALEAWRVQDAATG